jgi:hypothetical protein
VNCIERDYALTLIPFVVADDEITWHVRDKGDRFLQDRQHHSLANYKAWVLNGQFSIMLYDGALLQFTYELSGDRITSHRLGYVPCPIKDSDDVLSYLDFEDFFVYYESSGLSAAQLQSVIRFDFDPKSAAPGHPATHLTINSSDTRIACAGPISPDRFIRFIFAHFYPHLTDVVSYFDGLPNSGHYSTTISADDKSEMHINWAS